MEWLVIDEKYLNYLRDKESRIPKSDYGNDKYKPFFGVLFETDILSIVKGYHQSVVSFIVWINGL